MFIGGTNFGFMNGANHYETYAPDVTSYDYDALLTECGDVTPKYLAVRKVIEKHTGEVLPEIPRDREKRAYGRHIATASVRLFDVLNRLAIPVSEDVPLPMESHGIGYGHMVYRTELHWDYTDAKLSFESIGDRAQIYVNDTFAGTVYVNTPPYEVTFSAKFGDCLTVVVENMGRTNFGPKMMRKKGIVGRCLRDGKIHFGWQAWPLTMENLAEIPFDSEGTKKRSTAVGGEAFYRFTFDCDRPADTFLRPDGFRKGFAVLNGFNLGRYWEIGPQRTLYVPACVLHPGENELILFESDGLAGAPVIAFTDQPDLG